VDVVDVSGEKSSTATTTAAMTTARRDVTRGLTFARNRIDT